MNYDVLIIGAGPTGISCAIECKKNNLNTIVIEKGCLVNSIYHFPSNMIFFTTPDLLEIGELPLSTANPKPTREEGLNYYKRTVQHYQLNIRTYERVMSLKKDPDAFTVETQNAQDVKCTYRARFIILATGYYDNPNPLNIPGEDLPKVSHYYTDAHPYYGQDVLVIGGKNSACIAALELHRYGARVTVVHRQPEIKKSVKYWILPDFLNRVNEKSIALHLNSVVKEITEKTATIKNTATRKIQTVKNDFVFALTGYRPDVAMILNCGVDVHPETLAPKYDKKTFETNVPGLYVAGSVAAGLKNNEIFIENGRFHGGSILKDILKKVND